MKENKKDVRLSYIDDIGLLFDSFFGIVYIWNNENFLWRVWMVSCFCVLNKRVN